MAQGPRARGVLELFAGKGGLSAAIRSLGLRVLPAFDVRYGSIFDLTRKRTQDLVIRLLEEGWIWYVHLGTPCTIWSIARRGIKNFARAAEKERVGCMLALFTARVIRTCQRLGIKWSLENPATSSPFKYPPIEGIISNQDTFDIVLDMCRFGMSYKKPTRVVSDFSPLTRLGRRCRRDHVHTPLHGSKTTAAGEYPPRLCRDWARAVRLGAPRVAFGERWPAELDLARRLQYAAFGKAGAPREHRRTRRASGVAAPRGTRPPPGLEDWRRDEARRAAGHPLGSSP